jgi:DNA-3-methyladenine glycosylase I
MTVALAAIMMPVTNWLPPQDHRRSCRASHRLSRHHDPAVRAPWRFGRVTFAVILGQITDMVKMARCTWCGEDTLYVRYHDLEWGVPTFDRNALFELLVLESLQAGLSWITVLRKRQHLHSAMFALCPELIARMGPKDHARLLADRGVIRHRGKLESIKTNATLFLEMDRDGGAAALLWSFVGGAPVVNHWRSRNQVPTSNGAAATMAKALKGYGFKFFGPTICYSLMQASGMVNDHLVSCFRHESCQQPGARRCLVI